MPASLTIDLRGLDKVRAKLAANDRLLRPWAAALAGAGDIALGVLQKRAPRGKTGALYRGLVLKLDPKPVPRFVKVGFVGTMPTTTSRKTGKKFRYPGALEAGAKFHYRSGSYAGRPTKGWIGDAKRLIARLTGPLLRAAAKGIESEWRR